jgi:hypothetical protein
MARALERRQDMTKQALAMCLWGVARMRVRPLPHWLEPMLQALWGHLLRLNTMACDTQGLGGGKKGSPALPA